MSAEPDDDVAATAAAEDAAFASGFPDKPPEKGKGDDKPAKVDKAEKPEKAEGKAPEAAPPPVEKPEYVRVTKKAWEALEARTASYESQFSKAFGTIGNLQKVVNSLQVATPAGRKVPKSAFEKMAKDFPELAEYVHEAMEAGLSGTGGGPAVAAEIDDEKLDARLTARETAREMEALEDAYPDWKKIVGAVDISKGDKLDPNNPFRKWLMTKDVAYQDRLNRSNSAAVIGRAIERFQAETKGTRLAAPANPRADARADRIRDAVQPRGDNAGAAAGPSDDDEFMAGFNSR